MGACRRAFRGQLMLSGALATRGRGSTGKQARKLLQDFRRSGLAVTLVFNVSQSESGGYDEHLCLPKALAVPHTFPTPSLVGSEEASYASGQDQRRLCAAQRHARVHLCESRLTLISLPNIRNARPRAGRFSLARRFPAF
ncbi:hypothetical protein BCAR13_1630012 [Paraburkholderia caribensis]|nr:hypothetical protein BCAR13_1630012 [Paraburkholderia caribensis]